MNFNWFKAIGFGVLNWAVMFAVASLLVSLGVTINIGWSLALAVVMGITAYLFSMNAKAENAGSALGYGATFVVLGVILDLLISSYFVSGLFNMWTYYVGYALVLLAPIMEFGARGSDVVVHR